MALKILIIEPVMQEAKEMEQTLLAAGYYVCGINTQIEKALSFFEAHLPDLVLLNLEFQNLESVLEVSRNLQDKNIALIYTSELRDPEILSKVRINNCQACLQKPISKIQLEISVETAISNHKLSQETVFRYDQDLKHKLEHLAGSKMTVTEKLDRLAKSLQMDIPFDYLSVESDSDLIENGFISFLRVGFEEHQVIGAEELLVISKRKKANMFTHFDKHPAMSSISHFFGEGFQELLSQSDFHELITKTFALETLVTLPVILEQHTHFYFSFYHRKAGAYADKHLKTLIRLRHMIADFLQIVESSERTNRSTEPNENSVQKISYSEAHSPLAGIIGESPALENVFELIKLVAPVNTSVLLLGESGTGKERIAQAIHNSSSRSHENFVKVNCTVLPVHLIESELFGHEKGAFTGALQRHIGKFERANKGTIFLDEIGDMPHDLQAKLLRVIQEKEFERLGGNSPIKLDVRIIAATNLDLNREVSLGNFRMDLYFRLNVFPVLLPPLRDRREDIPLLISHFLEMYSKKMGKSVTHASPAAYCEAMAHDWPGNIRELENVIERGVLLCKGGVLNSLCIHGTQDRVPRNAKLALQGFKTIFESEREHIMNALQLCNGKVWGEGGAAALLKLPPTTLNSRMKRLGIQRCYK